MNSQVRYRILIALRGLVKFVFSIMLISLMTASSSAVVIEGGKMQDVVVLDSGSGPAQMLCVQFPDGNLQPDAFDIGQKGNIYLQDPLNARIQIFSNSGHFLREIKLNEVLKNRYGGGSRDLGTDRSGVIYLVDRAREHGRTYDRLVKFSKSGRLASQIRVPEVIKFHPLLLYTDFFSNVFLCSDLESDVFIYDKHLNNICEFQVSRGPGGFSNFAVNKLDKSGRVFFLRDRWPFVREMYVYVSTVSGIRDGVISDSIKLPDDMEADSIGLIGYDLQDNLYFFVEGFSRYGGEKRSPKDIEDKILRFQISGDRLVKTGEVSLNYYSDLPEEEWQYTASNLTKKYLVTGQGEIYFLHGTIKKLYISKLTFD